MQIFRKTKNHGPSQDLSAQLFVVGISENSHFSSFKVNGVHSNAIGGRRGELCVRSAAPAIFDNPFVGSISLLARAPW